MVDPRTPEGERIGLSRYCDHIEKRLADAEARIAHYEHALSMIAGREQCVDNLMSNVDIAIAALDN